VLSVESPRLGDAKLLTVSTAVIAVTSIAFGALLGWTAESKRNLVAQLHELAQRDFLTGLLNMRAFDESLAARTASPAPFALVLADLDGLKVVNDRDGHHAGNVLLRRVSEALREEIRGDDEAARVGGDEFAVLLNGVAAPADAEATARRLERRLERRGIWLSFGWAVYPADASTAVELFRRADERLYSSKVGRAGAPEPAAEELDRQRRRPLVAIDGQGSRRPAPPPAAVTRFPA
jgi:diguanylate cyclase (GGDEF)-like protein